MKLIENGKKFFFFLTNGIWRVTGNEVGRIRYILYDVIKIIILTFRRFFNDGIMTRAAALTYSTLFSAVPILALLFAIARGFGFQNILEKLFREDIGVAGETTDTLLGLVDSYLTHAKSGVFVGIGLIMLLWSVINLISTIERSMNNIWQVHKPRGLFRKITDYSSLFLLIPIVTVATTGISIFMTTFLKAYENYELLGPTIRFLIQLAPFIFAGIIFTAMFVFIPNTKVMLRHAIIPGFVTGIAFQWFQYFYIHSQVWVTGYNAIYGSFAAIPLFLLWANISWNIILFGCEASYISQNVQLFNFDKDVKRISRRYHDFLCILILSLICKRFCERDKTPYSAAELTTESSVPFRLVSRILNELQSVGFIYEKSGDEKSDDSVFLPAMDVNQISVSVLLNKIQTTGCEDFKVDREERFAQHWNIVEQSHHIYQKEVGNVLLKDLAL